VVGVKKCTIVAGSVRRRIGLLTEGTVIQNKIVFLAHHKNNKVFLFNLSMPNTPNYLIAKRYKQEQFIGTESFSSIIQTYWHLCEFHGIRKEKSFVDLLALPFALALLLFFVFL